MYVCYLGRFDLTDSSFILSQGIQGLVHIVCGFFVALEFLFFCFLFQMAYLYFSPYKMTEQRHTRQIKS